VNMAANPWADEGRRSGSLTGAGHSLLVSRPRASSLTSLKGDRPYMAPAVWPAVLVSLLHNLSMGAAMNVWLDVCKVVVGVGDDELDVSKPQTYYGRLLAANAVCELVTSQLVGVVSDKYGRRPVQVMAQLGQVIDYGIAGLVLPTLGIVREIPADVAEYLLFCSRGIAGFCGNYKVTLQSYTADISSAEECPTNLAALGGAMVAGMCLGAVLVGLVESGGVSFRACFFTSAFLNVCIMVIVMGIWRDIAPRKNYRCPEANPFAGMKLLASSTAMVIYSALIFLSSFALNMYVSTLAFYCEDILKMEKHYFLALGFVWAFESLISLAVVQPILTQRFGEIPTLLISFTSLTIFYLLFSILTPNTWGWAYVIIIFFSIGSMCYPIAVGLATRELPPEQQGQLQGAVSVLETTAKIFAPLIASDVLIPMFDKPGDFHGAVYFVAAVLMMPGMALSHQLQRHTCVVDPNAQVQLEMQ